MKLSRAHIKRSIDNRSRRIEFSLYANPPRGIEISISCRLLTAVQKLHNLGTMEAMAEIADNVKNIFPSGLELGQIEVVNNPNYYAAISNDHIYVDAEPFYPF